jgi:hypothetical protein
VTETPAWRGKMIATLSTFGLILAPLLAAPAIPAAAEEREVECSAVQLAMRDPGYDTSCFKDDFMFAGMGGTGRTDVLEATSVDGSHFLTALNIVAQGQVILTRVPLHKQLESMFQLEQMSNWRSGHGVGSMETSEFDADVKSIPSHCVGFQHFFGPEHGGYRGVTVGFGCSRNDREMVYGALQKLDIPSD